MNSDAIYLTVIVVVMIALSALFFKRHDEFMAKCMKSGRTFSVCWRLLE